MVSFYTMVARPWRPHLRFSLQWFVTYILLHLGAQVSLSSLVKVIFMLTWHIYGTWWSDRFPRCRALCQKEQKYISSLRASRTLFAICTAPVMFQKEIAMTKVTVELMGDACAPQLVTLRHLEDTGHLQCEHTNRSPACSLLCFLLWKSHWIFTQAVEYVKYSVAITVLVLFVLLFCYVIMFMVCLFILFVGSQGFFFYWACETQV